jgi:hypothetical protein
VGAVITQHLTQSERTVHKTREQLELIALLRSFQGRLVYQAQNQTMTPPGSREVQR